MNGVCSCVPETLEILHAKHASQLYSEVRRDRQSHKSFRHMILINKDHLQISKTAYLHKKKLKS